MTLLPFPRSVRRLAGFCTLPKRALLHADAELSKEPGFQPIAERLQSAASTAGIELLLKHGKPGQSNIGISACKSAAAPDRPEGYELTIGEKGVRICCREAGGLRAGVATLRQLLREHGRRLPRLMIRDYPDFARRGVMLDISRGRVPKLQTLLELVEQLADFKINELQLYTEHTFAYRHYKSVWRDWGALTGAEIQRLDRRCRELGIDLVPNQNSFGHLRYWLEHPPLKKLAETQEPYEDGGGAFLRYPTTLAPNHPGTLPFLRELYDELLPNFSSKRFNVGCDETWDLGRGQTRRLCVAKGKGQVYASFLRKIYREVTARGRLMMFWGDIILHYPELIDQVPKDSIALNWGYEAGHPFAREAKRFAEAQLPFYVCPGTSTWMTLIGRHDNALANLRQAAKAGRAQGAVGFLNTDWGDGGHPQPLAVSYLPYLTGAALSWCAHSFDEGLLVPVLSRDIFDDPTRHLAQAAFGLGLAHRKFDFFAPNLTPFGAVIAAPPPEQRELVCRDGLKYFTQIKARNIRAALAEVQKQLGVIRSSKPQTSIGELLRLELELAARMAAQSCQFMLWQQAAAGKDPKSAKLAEVGIQEIKSLREDFRRYWPLRNKGNMNKCVAFLDWRASDYRKQAVIG
jgi:hexosaminidase